MASTHSNKDWDDKKSLALTSFSLGVVYSWFYSLLTQIFPLGSKSVHTPSTIIIGKGNTLKHTTTTTTTTTTPDKQQQQQSPSPLSLSTPRPPLKRKTLILDLDETLVHSTIKPVSHHHITVEVVIDGVSCTFYVIKRPHVDVFLKKVAEWYDVVIFTASMKQYADPLIDQLDTKRLVKDRLFRESCLNKEGNFIKDLGLINQDLSATIIIDNSPIAYSHNKENALPIDNWMGDNPSDESLLNLIPFLNALRFTDDVRSILGLRV